ncbi:hypothetical protein PG987_006606 [Apiospora arundinis]
MQHLKDYGNFDHIVVPSLDHDAYRNQKAFDLNYFYNYPGECGWEVGHDYKLAPRDDGIGTKLAYAPFLQSWLWFGLIHTILRDHNGSSFVDPGLWSGHHSLDTSHLSEALRKWRDHEYRNRKGSKPRLMMAGCVLDHARRIVAVNLAHSIKHGRELSHEDEFFILQEPRQTDMFYISHVTALSIMVLGEALSTQKSEIMSHLSINVDGWQKDGWCRRTVRLLRGQLSSNATLFLAALHSHDASKYHNKYGCTDEFCKVVPAAEESGHYEQLHERSCTKNDCIEVMPCERRKLHTILGSTDEFNMEENFPIFRYTTSAEGAAKLDVEAWQDHRHRFATISHIWADGMGNEHCNSVHRCKLDFVKALLDKVSRGSSRGADLHLCEWFWLDTLGIPRKSNELQDDPLGDPQESTSARGRFRKIKRTAISQIACIFREADYSIVIDGGICNMDTSEKHAQVAMRILTSGWMRRLWTLQEAFLSKNLKVVFKQETAALGGIVDFDETIKSMTDSTQILRQKMMHNMMGNERETMIRGSSLVEPRGSDLITNAWRAVRWRSTSKAEDETLALANLMKFPYQGTRIKRAGVEAIDSATRENLMVDFWRLVYSHYKGSIPPGMIFLPGPRLSTRGFRWAPRTWMSSCDEDHPHPLGIMHAATELLAEDGLLVQYPGFVLHCQQDAIALILGSDAHRQYGFDFPVDPGFQEWYHVEAADNDDMAHIPPGLTVQQLAIIVSHPQPRESLAEIGLLVQVDRTVSSLHQVSGLRANIMYCRMIRRVRVRRMPSMKNPMLVLRNPRVCYGEALTINQQWAVDGFDGYGKSESESEPKDVMATQHGISFFNRARAAIQLSATMIGAV